MNKYTDQITPQLDHVIYDIVKNGVALPSYTVETSHSMLDTAQYLEKQSALENASIEVLTKTTRMQALSVMAFVYAPLSDFYENNQFNFMFAQVNPHAVVPEELIPAIRARLAHMLKFINIPFHSL
jgi:hypothetical protein